MVPFLNMPLLLCLKRSPGLKLKMAGGGTQLNTDNGLKFTNGYATSATCTPSRYALLTVINPYKINLDKSMNEVRV